MPKTFNSGTTIYGGLQTSNFDRPIPPTTSRVQSEPFFGDLGYSIDIPWPDVTTVGYMNGGNRPSRYEPTPAHWLELQRRLGRLGGGQTWRRLEHLGSIAKTDQTG